MKFICQYCGAEIDDSMPKCPYCDRMIAQGAEAEYMEKLYDIHEDMEELREMPMEAVKEEVRHQGKRMKKIVIATLIVVCIIAVVFFLQEKKYDRDHTEDYIWEEENFPVMTEMYENEEYDELMLFIERAWEEDRSVWNWEHYDEFTEWMEEQ